MGKEYKRGSDNISTTEFFDTILLNNCGNMHMNATATTSCGSATNAYTNDAGYFERAGWRMSNLDSPPVNGNWIRCKFGLIPHHGRLLKVETRIKPAVQADIDNFRVRVVIVRADRESFFGIQYDCQTPEINYIDSSNNWVSTGIQKETIGDGLWQRLAFSVNMFTGKYVSLEFAGNKFDISDLSFYQDVAVKDSGGYVQIYVVQHGTSLGCSLDHDGFLITAE